MVVGRAETVSVADVAYAIEGVAVEEEITRLVGAHLDEFDIYGGLLTRDIAFDQYRELVSSGQAIVITARVGGALIGYWIGRFFKDPHHSCAGVRVRGVASIAFYVRPEWRAKIARRFFRTIEGHLGRHGVSFLAQVIRPTKHLRSGEFFQALGYRPAEAVYTKVLKGMNDA